MEYGVSFEGTNDICFGLWQLVLDWRHIDKHFSREFQFELSAPLKQVYDKNLGF